MTAKMEESHKNHTAVEGNKRNEQLTLAERVVTVLTRAVAKIDKARDKSIWVGLMNRLLQRTFEGRDSSFPP